MHFIEVGENKEITAKPFVMPQEYLTLERAAKRNCSMTVFPACRLGIAYAITEEFYSYS